MQLCEPGQRLPSEHVLAEQYGVNRHTVRRSLASLCQKGLVRITQGSGTYVEDFAVDLIIGKRTRHRQNMPQAGLQGRFEVQDAQRTRAYQSNANILQGDDAKVYSKPELEIYADDVKCSHGCTIGRMDEQGLFYLRSRGVSEAEARRMMAHAFMTDVLERITNEDWRTHLATLIDAKLEAL